MRKIRTIRQLKKVHELIVQVVCPKCGTVHISSIDDARDILVYGCIICGDIEPSKVLSLYKTEEGAVTCQ